MKESLVEKLANLEHARWSHWQKYLHSKCIKNPDGSLTIPKESVDHWERQINTNYNELTEAEKDSDRKEVAKTLKIVSVELETLLQIHLLYNCEEKL